MTELASHSDEKKEREWWKNLVHEVFTSAGGVDNFEDFFHELYDVFARPQAWKLYEDVHHLLPLLKKQGKKLGIVSNWDSRLFKLCEAFELNQYFDFVIASAVFGASKPSPKIFQEALRLANVKPEEALHIGDSFEDDILGAQRVGLGAVLIDRHPNPRPHQYNPTIRSFKELL